MAIFICGFMGAGKTTFLEKLRATAPADARLLDNDEELNRRHNENGDFAKWIETVGWDEFRKRESQLVQEFSKEDNLTVIALGGGALSPENLKVIQQSDSRLVWMKTPYEVCCARIEGDSHRPLVGKGENYLQDLYNERQPRYAQSDLHLSREEQSEITFPGLRERLELDG